MNDEFFSTLVRYEWLQATGQLLPRLPGDSKTHEKYTTQEMELKNEILKEVADALESLHGKEGAK
ncbi:MAG: hypothetical protein NTV50_04375 [Planctomycetota bacterium]|nr:hypothetical protein [Planctomycetota bacterium]